MAYLDAHVALRLQQGLRAFADVYATGKALFDECLDGMIPPDDLARVYKMLFPEPLADMQVPDGEVVPERVPKCVVRTSYKGMMDGRLGTPDGSAAGTEGPAHFPAIVVDLVDEDTEGGIGSNAASRGDKRLHTYTQVVEVMIIAQTKHEVRALHILTQEMMIDSATYFAALGYTGGLRPLKAADLRPAEGMMAGLAPNLLGMFQRYMRWSAKNVRSTPRIYSPARVPLAGLSLHHVDSVGASDIAGRAAPQPPGITPPSLESIE